MKTIQVFISHTSDMAQFPESRSFVQAVLDAIGRAGMAPVDMRYFAARDGQPADYCRQRVRECEVYVAVVGFRYGTVVPGEAVSYTELEFAEASAAGRPRLVFLLADAARRPATPVPADADRAAVAGFRQRLLDSGVVVRGFASDASLELEVFHALTEAGRGLVQAPTSAAMAVRYSLPADTAAFTGRDEEIGRITAALMAGGGAAAIHAIGGMPGVGKTALAVRVAHVLRGQFPDRQLFVDLHAHTPGQDPALPETVLAGLLTVVGLDARGLPADLESRASLWRDRMAGQRAVLVLDNAASSYQVAPLLPGGDDCLVLITSRRHLGDLPGAATSVLLDVLPPGPAQDMFRRLAPRAVTGPAAAVPELAALAGHLPLAISLLARVYAKHPSWTLANLTRETQASLLTLAAEKGSVAAAFDVSYRYLPPAQQRLFRRLGLHPGTTIDAPAAAALAGVGGPEAAGLLDALHGEGLLTESGYRRYGMHDLLRRYARELAAAGGEPGPERLLDYYQAAAAIAELRLGRPSPAVAAPPAVPPLTTMPGLPDRARALSWARTERANLLACLDHAGRTDQAARIVALTAAVASLLRQDGPWTDAVTRHVTAVRAARRLGDRPGQANALNNLGVVRLLAGDYPGTVEALDGALAIYRDLGHRPGQASALHNLGSVRWRTDDLPAAAAALERALDIHRDLGDRAGQADDLSELSTVLHLTTDYPAAAATLEGALGIHRGLGDRAGQADDLNKLGSLRRQTGDYPAAAAALDAALGIYRDLGDSLGQARSLTILGAVRRRTGDYPGAAAALEAALGIHQELGYQLGEGGASYELGAVRRLTGDFRGATDALERALRITRGLGYRSGEVEILNEVGTLHRVRGDLDRAEASHREALDLARQIGSSWDEGHALAGLGRRALAAGRPGDAAAGLRQAWEIFRRIGAPEAGDVAEEIEALADAG
jgi:tetratricopeptide (TPR) repeat protein